MGNLGYIYFFWFKRLLEVQCIKYHLITLIQFLPAPNFFQIAFPKCNSQLFLLQVFFSWMWLWQIICFFSKKHSTLVQSEKHERFAWQLCTRKWSAVLCSVFIKYLHRREQKWKLCGSSKQPICSDRECLSG